MIKKSGARPPDPPPHEVPPRRLSWDELAPETPRRTLPWDEERRLADAELQQRRNLQRAEAWRDGLGDGAPVRLRGDVAAAIAAIAFESDKPVETVPLDDIVDALLRVGLGLDRPPPGQDELPGVPEGPDS